MIDLEVEYQTKQTGSSSLVLQAVVAEGLKGGFVRLANLFLGDHVE